MPNYRIYKVPDYCLKKGHNTQGYATQDRKHVYDKQLRLHSTWEVEVTRTLCITRGLEF